MGTHKATRRAEPGMTQRMEQEERGVGVTQTREMDVAAAQETKGGERGGRVEMDTAREQMKGTTILHVA